METKITFDTAQVTKNINTRISMAQKKLDAQVMKDSNYYCPMDSGDLQRSVLGSTLGSGLLVWSKDYAKKMYNFLTDKLSDEVASSKLSKENNINASVKWFEVAKSRKLASWIKLVDDEYGRGY